MTRKQALLLLLLALALGGFATFDLGRYLSLAALRESQQHLATIYAQSPWTFRAAYFALYVAVTSLSLPGAALLTLAGGGVLGLGWGLVLVSFASTLGATVSFWIARYVFRDLVQQHFGARLDDINRGLARDGVLYLLGLRLIPVVPFFAINLAMGLTTMRTWTYCWVSQVGMLAGTAVYVNAGTQLAQLRSLSDVASPGMLGAFTLLGVFPLLARRAMDALQRRKIYAPWKSQRPTSFDRNLVVIGAGAGGLVSAYIAAVAQARVTLVESHSMGGDCLNFGCVPSKALLRSAHLAHQIRNAKRYGLHSTSRKEDEPEAHFSFKAVMQRVQQVIAAIAPHDSVERYTALGVEVLQGHARITTPWSVEVALRGGGSQTLTTRNIIIATGARATVPDLPGLQDVGYVTSDTLWEQFAALEQAPARLLVLGGGAMGCEMAQAFARLGSSVTIVELHERLLGKEDPEVSQTLTDALRAEGIRILSAHRALRCEAQGSRKFLVVQHQGEVRKLEFDVLLCAVGRTARLSGFGLEELGLDTGATLPTNAAMQTKFAHIYAVGDVTGPFQLTHAAAHQAWHATVNALMGGVYRFQVDYARVPRAVFTDPEMAHVGLTEPQARASGKPFEVTRLDFKDLDRAIVDGHTTGFIKVLTDRGSDRILGVTIIGHSAAELLAEYVLAMQHGLGLNKILATMHTYPTLAEANKQVAGLWKRAHPPEKLLPWARKFHDWRRG